MKLKHFLFLTLLSILVTSYAQVPEGFSYQAVIRNNDRALLQNETVSIVISIMRNDVVIYSQAQVVATNDNGLVTLLIGGTPEFSKIDWANGPLYVRTQVDASGGDNYTIETETPLVAVPYAIAAKTAETAQTVAGLDYLIERINFLETRVAELESKVNGEEQGKDEISFQEYSFARSRCSLQNLNYDGTIIIINNEEEMGVYFDCSNPYSQLTPIDFSRKTLLLASGTSEYRVQHILKSLNRINEMAYGLDLNILVRDNESNDQWVIALLVDKISENYYVDLNSVAYIQPSDFVNYSLPENQCQWTNYEPYAPVDGMIFSTAGSITTDLFAGKLIIINSNEEMQNHLNCTDGEYPEIDFSNHTLLLSCGQQGYQDEYYSTKFHKLSSEKYFVSVSFIPSFAAAIKVWQNAIVIDKIDNNLDVELTIRHVQGF